MSFTINDIEAVRREVQRLEVVVYDKLLEIQSPKKHTNGERIAIFSCIICGKEFSSKRSVMTHIVRHHHLRPEDDLISSWLLP